jgi:hypothetical protein
VSLTSFAETFLSMSDLCIKCRGRTSLAQALQPKILYAAQRIFGSKNTERVRIPLKTLVRVQLAFWSAKCVSTGKTGGEKDGQKS